MDYLKDLAEQFKYAPQVLKMLQIHKRLNRVNLHGEAPQYCKKLEDVSQEIVDEALEIYQARAIKHNKAPHPNYFMSICMRKHAERKPKIEKKDEPIINIGRVI